MEFSDHAADAPGEAEAAVRAELFDAGTKLNIVPWMDTPGMNDAYFREIDMERQWPGEDAGRINAELRETPLRAELLPWPVPFAGRCWIDWTDRYSGPDGGLKIDTARHGMIFDDYSLVPAATAQIPETADYEPLINRDDERMHDTKTMEEIQADHASPTEWLRKPLGNEPGGVNGGHCDLRQAAVMVQDYHIGDEFRPVVNYSPLFAPFDGRHPEWYEVVNEDGTVVPNAERWMSMRPDGFHRLYLRPANWRWVTTVWASYLYVSWWEMFNTREIFTTAWFNRPPIYPRRHDLIHSTQVADFEYLNAYWSTDSGIDYGFETSRGAAFLRQQIVDAQWHTQSEAYIFTGNDPATLAMWLYPPDEGDIVLGIGTVDAASGDEQVVWIRQTRDLTDEYPRAVIGSYIIVDFNVAA